MDNTVDLLGCDPFLRGIVFERDFEIVIFMNMHAMTFKVATHCQSY